MVGSDRDGLDWLGSCSVFSVLSFPHCVLLVLSGRYYWLLFRFGTQRGTRSQAVFKIVSWRYAKLCEAKSRLRHDGTMGRGAWAIFWYSSTDKQAACGSTHLLPHLTRCAASRSLFVLLLLFLLCGTELNTHFRFWLGFFSVASLELVLASHTQPLSTSGGWGDDSATHAHWCPIALSCPRKFSISICLLSGESIIGSSGKRETCKPSFYKHEHWTKAVNWAIVRK